MASPTTKEETTTTIIKFVVGNNATKINDEKWRWQVFVEAHQQLQGDNDDDDNDKIIVNSIDRVVMHLHPTFMTQQVTLKKISRTNDNYDNLLRFQSGNYVGWGTFVVRIDVYINVNDEKEAVVELKHELVFGGDDGDRLHTTTFKVPIVVVAAAASSIGPPCCSRRDILDYLEMSPCLLPSDSLFWHGRAYQYMGQNPHVQQRPPKQVWKSHEKPRDDHGDTTPSWLTASEYCDVPTVMQEKVRQLASLIRLAAGSKNKTVIYSGAGISRAAGIGQAARGRGATRSRFSNLSTTAKPTFTHYAMAQLAKAGFIRGWVQQNHDGLPQKAGYPQENINEIHGSWYDPSNPVVLYSGDLKTDNFLWMREQAKEADLVLVMGTTLGGLNSDQVAHRCAERSLAGQSLGTVLINLQQTEHDGMASLRIFGETDKVFQALLEEMRIEAPSLSSLSSSSSSVSPLLAMRPEQGRVLVPYDEHGKRSDAVRMWWDLRPGAAIKLVEGHNVVGAGQPSHRPISKEGIGHVTCWKDMTMGIHIQIDGVPMCLGEWWIEAALRGGPKTLPILNPSPEMVMME